MRGQGLHLQQQHGDASTLGLGLGLRASDLDALGRDTYHVPQSLMQDWARKEVKAVNAKKTSGGKESLAHPHVQTQTTTAVMGERERLRVPG